MEKMIINTGKEVALIEVHQQPRLQLLYIEGVHALGSKKSIAITMKICL